MVETLKEIGYDNCKSGNYAGYSSHDKNVRCGWMDIHEDSGNLGDNRDPFFNVEPIYWNPKAFFVYKPRTKWSVLSKKDFIERKKVSGIKYTESGFLFNAIKDHGLVPSEIASELNLDGFLESKEYKCFVEVANKYRDEPLLVWNWRKK